MGREGDLRRKMVVRGRGIVGRGGERRKVVTIIIGLKDACRSLSGSGFYKS